MAWKCTNLVHESLNPRMDYFNNPKFRAEFEGSCLNLDKETFAPNKNCFVYYL